MRGQCPPACAFLPYDAVPLRQRGLVHPVGARARNHPNHSRPDAPARPYARRHHKRRPGSPAPFEAVQSLCSEDTPRQVRSFRPVPQKEIQLPNSLDDTEQTVGTRLQIPQHAGRIQNALAGAAERFFRPVLGGYQKFYGVQFHRNPRYARAQRSECGNGEELECNIPLAQAGQVHMPASATHQ